MELPGLPRHECTLQVARICGRRYKTIQGLTFGSDSTAGGCSKEENQGSSNQEGPPQEKNADNVDSEVAEGPFAADIQQSGSDSSSAQRERRAGSAKMDSSDGAGRDAAGRLCALTLDEGCRDKQTRD